MSIKKGDKMKINDFVAYYKTGVEFRRQTGMARVNWYEWQKKGYIPIESQCRLEKITNGELKANYNDVL